MTTVAGEAAGVPVNAVLLALVLTGFVAVTYGFGVYLFASLVVDMRRDLGFDYTTVGLITGAAQAGFLLFSFAAGPLVRCLAGWRVALYSTVLCALALLGLGISNSVPLSGCLLILLGGCSASSYVPLAEIVTRQFAPARRARVMGLISSGTSYGVFINGLMVSLLMSTLGWRGIWLVAGSLALVLCAVAWYCLRGLTAKPEQADRVISGNVVTAPWCTVAVLLTWMLALLNGLTLLPFQTYLAPYMRDGLGLSAESAGLVWSIMGAVGMIAGFAVGTLADRVGARRALILCFASAAFGAGVAFQGSSEWAFSAAGVLFALAFYPIFGLVPSYLATLVPLSRLTQAFGIANVLIGLGGMLGNLLGGALRDLTGSFSMLYLFIAGVLLLQGLLVVLLPDRRQPDAMEMA